MSFEQFTQLKYPFKNPIKYHVMLEVESNLVKKEDKEKPEDPGLNRLFTFVSKMSEHMIDGVFPQDQKQADMIWDMRECVAPACAKYGTQVKYDVSLPGQSYYDIID